MEQDKNLMEKYGNLTSHFERSKKKSISELAENFRIPEKEAEKVIETSVKMLKKAFKIPDVNYRVVKHHCGDLDIVFEIDAKNVTCDYCGEEIK